MRLLVVAATEMEIAPFVAAGTEADVLVTGVGAPHCIYHLTKKLSRQSYDFIIQAGIAGSFGELPTGETWIIKKDCYADLGIYENKTLKSLFDAGFLQQDEFPYTKGWLVNDNEWIHSLGLKTCTSITVNTVSENTGVEKLYKELYNPQLESMEGAAFHYVCLSEKIPFVQLRAISNVVGVRDKSQWRIKESVASLNKELIRIADIIKQKG
ncbi:MAG: futalosine hydrolase [Ferruginibacter sp.]